VSICGDDSLSTLTNSVIRTETPSTVIVVVVCVDDEFDDVDEADDIDESEDNFDFFFVVQVSFLFVH